VAGPDIAAQLIHDDDAQQLGCAVEALVAEEQAAEREDGLRPARRQRTGEAGGAARSVLPSADEDLIAYITTGARAVCPRPALLRPHTSQRPETGSLTCRCQSSAHLQSDRLHLDSLSTAAWANVSTATC